MNRRDTLALLLVLGTVGGQRGVFAQVRDRPARIGLLDDGYKTSRALYWTAFRNKLGDLGYVQGKGYTIDGRWADARLDRLPALAAELVAKKPDVIVAAATPAALAAKNETSSIPIVVFGAFDPIKSGLVASLARPEGNVTGITPLQGETVGKLIELLREVAPNTKSIAFLVHTANAASMLAFPLLQGRARKLGATVQAFDGSSRSNVDFAFREIKRKQIDSMIVSSNAALFDQRQQIVDAAARQKIPAIYMRREYVDVGGLMSFGTALDALYARGAEYVHRILQGTKPSELPFEQASTFKLVLNLKVARALGLKIPDSWRVRVDEVIE